jgi:hypothetical protein
MTTKTLNIADLNLLSGSSELIRQALGGYWVNDESSLTAVEVSLNQIIESLDSNYAVTSTPVDPESLIDSVRYASRIYGTSDTSRIRSDEEWRAYVVGGSFGAKTYNGVYNEVIYFDHRTEIDAPLYNNELSSDSDSVSGESLAEYYKFYERYQNNLLQVASEHLLPNFYFLISQDIDDLDIAKMMTLDGTIEEDYFNYISFQNELKQEQRELVNFAESTTTDAELGQQIIYYTEVSDPEEGAINTLFSNVASDKGVPRYSYNNIRDYLNVFYVNHTYQQSTIQRLQTRLQNIMFLEPSVLKEHNDQLIATDFSFLKDDKKQAVYSLMPMANNISFEVDDSEIGNGLRSVIEANEYAPRFLKTLKEVFTDEITLKPTSYSFAIDNTYGDEVTTRELRILDLPEMILYDYENVLSRTNNAFFYGASTPETRATFDNTGAYRFVNSEIAVNALNDVIKLINNNFSAPQSLEHFLNDPVDVTKEHEVLAYRVQKIGGPPTGDSRTENTLQNFWFFNKGEAIKYIDTQVKYSTDYTYNIFSYVAVQGYKYRLSDLAVTRQIATEDGIYCLEFYDPTTGDTTSRLLNPFNPTEIQLPKSNFDIDEIRRVSDRLTLFERFLDEAMSSGSGGPFATTETVEDGTTTSKTETESYTEEQLEEIVENLHLERVQLLVDGGILNYLKSTGQQDVQSFINREGPYTDGLNTTVTSAIRNLLNDIPLNSEFTTGEINQFFTNAQLNSTIPYLADFNINIEPSLKIVEVPIQEKTFKILDNPPNDLIATPHHLKDQSNRIAFFLSYDTFSIDEVAYPTTLTPQDDQNKTDYLTANDLDAEDFIQSESVSMAETFEVYRLSRKPTSYQDFENNLRKSINLRILKQGRIKLDAMFMEKVRPNQKYYYTFRAINENGIAGGFTPIFEVELINDGGYVYANFNQLTAEDLVMDNISDPLMSFKKLFNVVPNIQHLILDSTAVDFSKSAFDQVGNFKLGTAEEPLFRSGAVKGKTFKLRLTSKKTGKKIDLNITFNKTNG